MEYLILDMARLLRRSGIGVSTQEIEDCLNILRTLGKKIDKYTFYHLMNNTMIKTPWGADFILWLIGLYYEPDAEIAMDHLNLFSSQVSSVTGERLGSTGQGAPVDLMVDAVLKKNLDLIFAIVKGLNLSLEPHWEDREKALEHFQMRSGWLEVIHIIEKSHQYGQIAEQNYLEALETLEEWKNLLQDEIELQLEKNMSREYLMKELKKRNPRTVHFLESDDAQFLQMSREIQKLARKLAVRKGRRRKVGIRGLVNVNKSIKRSLQTGGVPLSLVRMQRKPAKPDLWLLCDMSNSVSKFSYFMLMFVYATQNRYAHIRSFLFVDMLLEITDYFQEQDWSSVWRSLGKLRGFNRTGYSHYGNVLQQFADQALPFLSKKTTVLILGDAKNNWNKLDGSEILLKIKETAAALYWLNPMNRSLWASGDCLMEKYKESCTEVFQCSNIEQLEQFLSAL